MSGPLSLGLATLRRRLGNRREIDDSIELEGLELPSVNVGVKGPVDVELVVEAVPDGVTVVGAVRASWEGECRRCLEPVSGDVAVDVRELFADRPLDEDTFKIEGDTLDLEPLVREAVLLSLPLVPLCREDCPGPAPEVFPVTVEGEEEDSAPPVDPRWAALDALRTDLAD